ncbi:neuropeptide CCHamide-1 receptor-like [Macrosteles quadrilineatus]|uniref:neuropeptide CCHamide-1 receptor-like n=1 Tax=Macrosteles quadrilineatus TaxID=74068 RepID=UPI0023E1D602|nr:neuropeptide CCHamide-1 receptor-like [Macrosteles quadrilineatus]
MYTHTKYNICEHEGTGKPATAFPPYEERPETYYVPVLFAIIFILGVVGNGIIVITFLRHKTMRSSSNTYIFSLALADLLVIITCVPFTSILYTVKYWPFGTFLCKLSMTTKDIFIGVSVFTLAALSARRYIPIKHPIRQRVSEETLSQSTRTVLAIWGLAIFVSVPSAIGAHLRVINSNPSAVICYPYPAEYGLAYAKGVVLAKFLIHYVIPFSTIAIVYIMIARQLIISTRNISLFPGGLQPHQARLIKERRKTAKKVLVYVLIFAVFLLPHHVFLLWFYWFSENPMRNYNKFWHYLRIIGFCLTFANSFVNPFILYDTGTFGKHFNRYLRCRQDPSSSQERSSSRRLTNSRTTSWSTRSY